MCLNLSRIRTFIAVATACLAVLLFDTGQATAQEAEDEQLSDLTLTLLPQLEYAHAPQGIGPSISVPFLIRKEEETVGLMGFALVSKEYAEAYVGPTLYFGPLMLGLGIGLDQVDPNVVGGLVASLNSGPLQLLGTLELNGLGLWGRFEGAYYVHELLGLGAMAQADYGAGPRLEFMIPSDIPITLYGATLYRWWTEEVVGLGGVRLYVN